MKNYLLGCCAFMLAMLTVNLFAVPDDWTIGPFQRPANSQPVIKPNPDTLFDCPMRQKPVAWQSTHTFNPAAVVKDGKIYVLYRAEDNIGQGIGGYTSRLGLAVSDDGIHFTSMPQPVLYPANDEFKRWDWDGGCEDPRVTELEDGSYVLFYTQYKRSKAGRSTTLGIAFSRDLQHWEKKGPLIAHDAKLKIVTPSKSASLLCCVKDGRLIAKKINDRYWLYQGEGAIRIYSSPDLIEWQQEGDTVLEPRAGHFDSGFPESGPPAVLTSKGIVFLYNGKNANGEKSDPKLKPGVYANGQALFDPANPVKLLARTDEPFFQPELDWERTGQYAAGTTFIEGLVLFKNKWFLYYGCADTFVGVAIADAKPAELSPP